MTNHSDESEIVHQPTSEVYKTTSEKVSNLQQQMAVLRVRRALPNATDEMVLQFARSHQVSLTTVAIWAEQGAIKTVQNDTCTVCEIVKTRPYLLTPSDAAKLLQAMYESDRLSRYPSIPTPKSLSLRPGTGHIRLKGGFTAHRDRRLKRPRG